MRPHLDPGFEFAAVVEAGHNNAASLTAVFCCQLVLRETVLTVICFGFEVGGLKIKLAPRRISRAIRVSHGDRDVHRPAVIVRVGFDAKTIFKRFHTHRRNPRRRRRGRGWRRHVGSAAGPFALPGLIVRKCKERIEDIKLGFGDVRRKQRAKLGGQRLDEAPDSGDWPITLFLKLGLDFF